MALTDAEGAVAQRGRRGKVVVDTAGAASPRDVGVLRLRMGLGGELAVLASSALRRGLVQSDTEGVVTAAGSASRASTTSRQKPDEDALRGAVLAVLEDGAQCRGRDRRCCCSAARSTA